MTTTTGSDHNSAADSGTKLIPDGVVRKAYVAPRLEWYGDVRDITLAESPGDKMESGLGSDKKFGT